MDPVISSFSERIGAAAASRRALRIRGSGSKDFFGVALEGEVLDTIAYAGIVSYEPTELVLTARAGTRLRDVEAAVAERGQMLAFEPPHFGERATLGGCVAAGFSGPRRAAAGAVRDYVLGVRMLNGAGEDLRFGGQVMKNVAGFDVSRLMTGSFGTLGLMLEISLKVLPRPQTETTVRFELDQARALRGMNEWAGRPLPISATYWSEGALSVRLSGADSAVTAARLAMGGEPVSDAGDWWRAVREQTLPAFDGTVWRFSVQSTAPPLDLPGRQMLEWNGSLRWISGTLDPEHARAAAHRAGGHATLFRGGERSRGLFTLEPGMLEVHRRLKSALDPNGIFGPRRLHPDF
jgi:glycolate oxidase FAD binding subunit